MSALTCSRTLKISERVEASPSRWKRERREPMIRMRGEWLEENGFVAGARVEVTVERGRIVLTLAAGE